MNVVHETDTGPIRVKFPLVSDSIAKAYRVLYATFRLDAAGWSLPSTSDRPSLTRVKINW